MVNIWIDSISVIKWLNQVSDERGILNAIQNSISVKEYMLSSKYQPYTQSFGI